MLRYILFVFFPITLFAQTSFEKAEKLFEQKNYSQAKPLFESYLKSNQNHVKSIEYLGDIAGTNKNWDEAITYYEKLKESYPSNADYHYKYGGALGMKAKESNKFTALGLIDDVEDSFLKAAKLDSKHVDARWALVILYLELPAIIGGSESKSQKYATELLTISKVDGYLAKGYIDVYFKRYKKAELHYKNAHIIGNSNTTYAKLYDLYSTKLKDSSKASSLKKEFNK